MYNNTGVAHGMKLTLYTSGSTKEPKQVSHSNIDQHVQRSIKEIGLTSNDIVLDVFPANVIAHYTVTALPALVSGARLVTANFDPYTYIKIFNEVRPTYIALVPRHYEVLSKLKSWKNFDMSCVRYMVTGSGPVPQSMIDDYRSKGVQLVANWYGMTEMPPPVFVAYNSESFDFSAKDGYSVEFASDGECIINGWNTGDVFDTATKKFLRRKAEANGKTWKNNIQ